MRDRTPQRVSSVVPLILPVFQGTDVRGSELDLVLADILRFLSDGRRFNIFDFAWSSVGRDIEALLTQSPSNRESMI